MTGSSIDGQQTSGSLGGCSVDKHQKKSAVFQRDESSTFFAVLEIIGGFSGRYFKKSSLGSVAIYASDSVTVAPKPQVKVHLGNYEVLTLVYPGDKVARPGLCGEVLPCTLVDVAYIHGIPVGASTLDCSSIAG